MSTIREPKILGRRAPASLVGPVAPPPEPEPEMAPGLPMPASYETRHILARAAAAAEAAAGQAVRDSLSVYAVRARAAHTRLEAWRPAAAARWGEFGTEHLNTLVAQLGGDARGSVAHARGVVARLRAVYDPPAPMEGGAPVSTLALLGRIGRRIDALGAQDSHACPTRCGCPIGALKADVEDGERAAVAVPRDVAALDALRVQLDGALALRGAPVTILPARPAGPAVEVLTPLSSFTPDIPEEGT